MTEATQPKNSEPDPIVVAVYLWRAVDKAAAGTKRDSPQRAAEYRARQDLRKAVDEAGEA